MVNAQWFICNEAIHKDLQTESIREVANGVMRGTNSKIRKPDQKTTSLEL